LFRDFPVSRIWLRFGSSEISEIQAGSVAVNQNWLCFVNSPFHEFGFVSGIRIFKTRAPGGVRISVKLL